MNPRSAAQHSFPKGTRVRLNQDGMNAVNVLQNRSGVVVGYCRNGAVRVRWDGNKSDQPWACEFLMAETR